MKDEAEVIGRRPSAMGDADRGDEPRAVAVGDLIRFALDHGWGCWCCWRLADRRCDGSQGKTTGQRGAAFQEFPSKRSFRANGSLLRRSAYGGQIGPVSNRLPDVESIRLRSAR